MGHFLYRYSSVIITALLLVGIVGAVVYDLGDWRAMLTVVGAALSLVYFLQKQRLDETRLFKELFSEFNHRYDNLNADLVPIRDASPKPDLLTAEQKQNLYDYFNLCGEEYFFFKQGYVPKLVWRAWLLGMKEYYADPRIRKLWDSELQKASYYGLSKKILES